MKGWVGLLMILAAFTPARAEVVTLPELMRPENIIVDQGQVLVTEFPKVYVYDTKSFRLICSFGKAGEGPKEFQNYVRIQYRPEEPQYIVVGSHMKMSYYTRQGEWVKEIRSKTSTTANVYKPLGDRFVAYGFFQEGRRRYNTVNLFDSDLRKIREICRWEDPVQENGKIDPTDSDLTGGEFRIHQGLIYVLLRKKGDILIYDSKGEPKGEIHHDYPRRPFTSEDRVAFDSFYKNDPRYKRFYEVFVQRVDYPSTFPSTREFFVDGERIFVLTWVQEEGKSRFAVFGTDGKWIGDTMVPFADQNAREYYPFCISSGKLFQLVDNPGTERWDLHIHRIQEDGAS